MVLLRRIHDLMSRHACGGTILTYQPCALPAVQKKDRERKKVIFDEAEKYDVAIKHSHIFGPYNINLKTC